MDAVGGGAGGSTPNAEELMSLIGSLVAVENVVQRPFWGRG